MKNLFVGCKVRVVQNGMPIPPEFLPFIGKVGIITMELGLYQQGLLQRLFYSKVKWEVVLEGGLGQIYADSPCLEPILPSGHTAASESHEEFMTKAREGIIDVIPT